MFICAHSSEKVYVSVRACMRVCVCGCMFVCVRACAFIGVCMCVCVCMCACMPEPDCLNRIICLLRAKCHACKDRYKMVFDPL